jgi:molybdenum cofactor cytidylyltransferase
VAGRADERLSREPGAALALELALGAREHVAIVGAGGKTTVLLALWDHLTASGRRVLATTTTKVAADEVARIPFLSAGRIGPKLLGIDPADADHAFASGTYDVVLVEADGARHLLVKAPAEHEPVIPATATLVIAVMAADALGRVIEDVAYNPLRVAALAGCSPYDRLTVAGATRLLTSDRGGRRGVPPGARFGVVLTRVAPSGAAAAAELAAALRGAGVPSARLPQTSG